MTQEGVSGICRGLGGAQHTMPGPWVLPAEPSSCEALLRGWGCGHQVGVSWAPWRTLDPWMQCAWGLPPTQGRCGQAQGEGGWEAASFRIRGKAMGRGRGCSSLTDSPAGGQLGNTFPFHPGYLDAPEVAN